MDHRRLQRTLFRMQHDAAFAARLRRGDAASQRSTGLGEEALAWLRAVDPVALAADRDGQRTAQLLRNVSSELPLSVAVGPDGRGARGWIHDFPASDAFHGAVARDESLPRAFARHALAVAQSAAPAFRRLVALEAALVEARRSPLAGPRPPLPPGSVRRSAGARLLTLAAGTFALAGRIREALDAGAEHGVAGHAPPGPGREHLLLLMRPGASRFAIPEIHVEPLSDPVAAFFDAAQEPLPARERAAFASRHGIAAEAMEAVVGEFVAEGALEAG